MARITTRERWGFTPYSINNRGERDIPLIYLKTARWRNVQGSTGYFVNIPTRPAQYYPVEFNHNFVCWTEITWNAPNNRWDVVRPAGPDYRCDIFEDEVRTAGQVGPIDGEPNPGPRTPTPSTDDEEEGRESENSEGTVETGAPGDTTEEERLANLAESIHINPPAMTTMTEPTEIMTEGATYIRREMVGEINPQTGHWEHRTADDEAALRRAQEPDRPDPPSGGPERLPELPPIRLPQDDQPRRRLPRGGGGFPGGGGYLGGGGVPPGGPPGGGWGPPPMPMPQAHQGKLVGEPPTIYDGDRKKTTLFINEWELYWAVNNDNALMINPYRRAMFFLTYIKGSRVNEWVMAVNRWLARQIQGGINTADEQLWNEVAASFTRRFADSLAKENAQSILRAGVKMKGEDIDAYVVEIEELIRLAEYRFDVPQTIETFMDGLPTGLYQKVLELDRPTTYKQWKQAAINRQQDYIHMKARLKVHHGGMSNSRPRGWMPRQMMPDPNAMDTSAGRTWGRVTGSDEMNPATMPRRGYVPRGGFMQGNQRGGRQQDLREVECYTCHKKGHLSRNCPQHTWNRPNNAQRSWTPRPSQGHEAVVDDRSICNEEPVITARGNTQTPQQQADTWLRGVASAGEDIQELVMRDLVGREGFQNA